MTSQTSAESAVATATAALANRSNSRPARFWRLVRKRPLLGVSLFLLFILFLMLTVGPFFAPYPAEGLVGRRLQAPSSEFWFGTDALGRDILSRCIAGARLSLTVGVATAMLGVSIGGFIGALSGFRGGLFDLISQRLLDALNAIPTIILALAMVAVLGSQPRNLILAMVVVFIPGPVRIIRSSVLGVKQNEYMLAATALGATQMRILIRHVIPQIMAPYFIVVSSAVGSAILVESSLSFLGVGPPPPAVSWGKMMGGETRIYIESAPWALLFPAAFLTMVVYAFNLLGDSLRDILDPRLRGS